MWSAVTGRAIQKRYGVKVEKLALYRAVQILDNCLHAILTLWPQSSCWCQTIFILPKFLINAYVHLLTCAYSALRIAISQSCPPPIFGAKSSHPCRQKVYSGASLGAIATIGQP